MFKSFGKILKRKDLLKRLLFTLLMVVIIRIGSQLPAPGVNRDYFSSWFESQTSGTFNLLNAFTGGSFSSMSIFALSITPYITSSIIIQLLTIAFPKLEEIQRDGEAGKKKIAQITRITTMLMSVVSSLAMAIGFGNSGLLEEYNALSVIMMVGILTAGTASLVWIGDMITEHGLGNGISIVLIVNIISTIPQDITSLFTQFVIGQNIGTGILAALAIIAVIGGMVLFVIVLGDALRLIPIQSSRKLSGYIGTSSSVLPIRVNTAGVMPIIFASAIVEFPIIISSFVGYSGVGVWNEVLKYLSSSYWCSTLYPRYTLGMIVYFILIIFFAYFYTQVTFNTIEVADNLKKAGSVIPGIRPGTPTKEYLNSIIKYIILVGAIALIIVSFIPFFFSGMLNASVSFGGTSLIIIASVILETINQVKSSLTAGEYKRFV